MKPIAAKALLDLAIECGWAAMWQPGKDTGDSPFVTVSLIRGAERIDATWHTRNTCTYRLMHATTGRNLGMRTVTLTKAKAQIQAAPNV